MPDNSTAERKAAMTAYGAELILVTKEEGMEGARDLALQADDLHAGVLFLEVLRASHDGTGGTHGAVPRSGKRRDGRDHL